MLPDSRAYASGRLFVYQVVFELRGVEPRVVEVVGLGVVAREEVPVDVRVYVPVAGVVHLPRFVRPDDGPPGRDEFVGEREVDGRRKLVQLPHVLLQEQQAVAAVELVVADEEDGVLELVDEMRVAPVAPARDSLTDRTVVFLTYDPTLSFARFSTAVAMSVQT